MLTSDLAVAIKELVAAERYIDNLYKNFKLDQELSVVGPVSLTLYSCKGNNRSGN